MKGLEEGFRSFVAMFRPLEDVLASNEESTVSCVKYLLAQG